MAEIALICVLYNPSEECVDKWLSLSDEFSGCIFVDNTPKVTNRNFPQATYISLGENRGIAAAQNAGIARARELGYKYVIFFDQDSNVTPNLIKTLHDEYNRIKNSGIKIGAIGPTVEEISSGKEYKSSLKKGCLNNEVSVLISSGTFTEISNFDEIGLMESELFIDIVDFEWCWRALKKDFHFFISTKARMRHQVGNKFYSFGGMRFIVSSPFRYYYKYRNYRRMLSRSYVPTEWKIKTGIKNMITLLLILFYPQYNGQRVKTLKYAFKGLLGK